VLKPSINRNYFERPGDGSGDQTQHQIVRGTILLNPKISFLEEVPMNEKPIDEQPFDSNATVYESRGEGSSENSNETASVPTVNYGLPPTLENPHAPSNFENETGLIRLNEFWSYHPKLHTIGLSATLEQFDMTKIEQRRQALANDANAGGWTLTIDHFATAEGRHVYFLRSRTASEDEARAHFRRYFFADLNDDDWTQWSLGLHAHRGAFWPDFLSGMQVPPDELEMHWYTE
jgi:hypothetical protein